MASSNTFMSTIKKRKIILVRKLSPRPRYRGTEAPHDKYFWVHNGPIVKNLKELMEALHHMSDRQYEYHTGPRGNDFARWVNDVLEERVLAKKVTKAEGREKLISLIAAYIS